jgi:5-methylcytosine-specific restriction protein A
MRFCAHPNCSMRVPFGRCQRHRLEHEREMRGELWEIRKWYRTARWRAIRARKRRENPLCVECLQEAPRRVRAWTELDHITPHRGDPVLFWQYENLQGLCDEHHGQKTQRGE